MKHYLLLTTALAGLSVMAAPLAQASITTTTTTTWTYDFPDSDPVVSTSSTTTNNCPPVYNGGGGGGGSETGGGLGGYRDTTGDGRGDTHSYGVSSSGLHGNVSSGYGVLTGNASRGGASSGSSSSDSSRVICTHFYQKGELGELLYFADIEFTRRNLHPSIVRGYHAWGIWYVERMRRHPGGMMERIMRPIALHRANEVGYKMGLMSKPDVIGKLVRITLEPLCFLVGVFTKERDWRRLYTARDFADFAAGYRRYTALKAMRMLGRHKQAVYAGQAGFTGSYRGPARPGLELYKVLSGM